MKFRLTDEEPSDKKPGGARSGLLHVEHLAAVIGVAFVLATAAGFSWWIFMSSPGREDAPEPEPQEEPDNSALIDPMLPQSGLPSQPYAPALPPPALPPPAPAPAPAAITPAPPVIAPPAPPMDRVTELRRFVTDFDGGSCFLALPVRVSTTEASIEAFSASVPAAEALDRSFLQANGFEAQIGVRPVSPAQCAAIEFARRFANNHDAAPGVELDSSMVRSGDRLGGTVNAVLEGDLALLLVAEDGSVFDFSRSLSRSGRPARFSIDWQGSGRGVPEPFLLMAVSSRNPLPMLAAGGSLPIASELFPRLADEALRTTPDTAVALSYGKVGG